MEDFSRFLGINWTFSLICCMFWIFSPAEGYTTISQVVGSKVILPCKESLNTFKQLTWKMNGVSLYSIGSQKQLYVNEEMVHLKINMSSSESEQYALVMDQVQKSHEGNYTCEIATPHGAEEHTWELIVTNVTAKAENQNELVILVATIVPCCLVFIFSLIILRVCKQHAQHSIQSPHVDMLERTEVIYTCLETDVNNTAKIIFSVTNPVLKNIKHEQLKQGSPIFKQNAAESGASQFEDSKLPENKNDWSTQINSQTLIVQTD